MYAQDAIQLDAKHYKVEYEDEKVRVVRFTLPPGESSPMHEHGERVVVVVRGGTLRHTDGEGRVTEVTQQSGMTAHRTQMRHSVTNIGKTIWEVVYTEFKGTATAAVASPLPSAPPPSTSSQAQAGPQPAPAATQAPSSAPAIAEKKPAATESLASQLEERVAPVSPIKGAKTVSVNGQTLTYVEAGKGEPIVLVHGVAADLRGWSRQIDELSKSYRVIAYSARYHYPNNATGKEDDYTIDQHAKDLSRLIETLQLGNAHVVGHSYGGAVVLAAVMAEPKLFRSAIVIEPPLEALLPQLQADSSRYARRQILSMVRREILRRNNIEGAMRTYVDWSRGSGAWDALSADSRQRYTDNGKALAAYSAHPEPFQFNCEDGKKVAVPLLVLSGEASAPNARITSATLAECVPGAKRVVVSMASHYMHRENAEAFNKALLNFLATVK